MNYFIYSSHGPFEKVLLSSPFTAEKTEARSD